MSLLQLSAVGLLAAHIGVSAYSLESIDHVVLFMQENRAFDHYYGTMAGVRGFADPNAQVNPNGNTVFYQEVPSSLSNVTDELLPWYLNWKGGNWTEATQCIVAGDNGWVANHGALNFGLNNQWPRNNTPYSWGYFKREDIPVQFGIADAYTVADMYQESVIGATMPNRAVWASGNNHLDGNLFIDNMWSPGCDATGFNCFPLTWKTIADYYQESNVTWQVWQNVDNWEDNPFSWFEQFIDAANGSAYQIRGNSNTGLDKFFEAAAEGTLPQVSFIISDQELTEHPPYMPKDGGWIQQQIFNAVVKSPKYNSTVLMLSYDESGGWGDHVVPYTSPEGTEGEWILDPYDTGFGPYTRGGHVFTENADHNSQILFVEKWLAAKGHNVTTEQMPEWRRNHMSDLTKAFDFMNPDFSIPELEQATYPLADANALWSGSAYCEAKYGDALPPVPYGLQNATEALATEQGYKKVRGQLTEGRWLTFELNGYALSNPGNTSSIVAGPSTPEHEEKSQRWVLQQLSPGGNVFHMYSALDGKYISAGMQLATNGTAAQNITLTDMGNGQGYTFIQENGLYASVAANGTVGSTDVVSGFQVFSVTYAS
ncbi:hypothetical protein BP6252_10718 [Coleophoma cylindrospora]|uniref:Non-hemolytic phospholipase C n=1 Tax=Coleophoma cylindrospora TaxID=1849047 RepID=A0A3D8QTG3_9HELO|nr:hypothetical protein BP6252_10718 [Coleophoma cylindrospora]